MIDIKNKAEIEKMKVAGKVVAKVHKALKAMIKPGVTLLELDKKANSVILDNHCKPSFLGYGGFPGSICSSVNDVIVHGIPDDYAIKEGDMVSIDVGACFKGYHGDAAFTVICGKPNKPDDQKMLDIAEESLFLGIDKARVGNKLGDICHAIGEHLRKHGYGIPQEYAGHGIGKKLHMDPMVPNEGEADTGITLVNGMVLAIEPMAHMGGDETFVETDDWTVKTKDGSLACHTEHTVLITEEGPVLLTHLEPNKLLNK